MSSNNGPLARFSEERRQEIEEHITRINALQRDFGQPEFSRDELREAVKTLHENKMIDVHNRAVTSKGSSYLELRTYLDAGLVSDIAIDDETHTMTATPTDAGLEFWEAQRGEQP
jgi:hypothetical protein